MSRDVFSLKRSRLAKFIIMHPIAFDIVTVVHGTVDRASAEQVFSKKINVAGLRTCLLELLPCNFLETYAM